MVQLYYRDAREVEGALDLVLTLVEIGSNLPAAVARSSNGQGSRR